MKFPGGSETLNKEQNDKDQRESQEDAFIPKVVPKKY
jgi:hypothetical protein